MPNDVQGDACKPQTRAPWHFGISLDDTSDTTRLARTYFSQGHEINFVQVKEWTLNNLVTLGSKCRAVFTKELLALLDVREVPAAVKIAWNDLVKKVVAA